MYSQTFMMNLLGNWNCRGSLEDLDELYGIILLMFLDIVRATLPMRSVFSKIVWMKISQ